MSKQKPAAWWVVGCIAWWWPLAMNAANAWASPPRPRYEPTSPTLVAAMLDMAGVGEQDVVYDLGSGDGRIPIAAARRGAMAVGIEIDPELVSLSRDLAEQAGVGNRVRILQGDIFEADLGPATVVTLFLLPATNLALRPKLLRELQPGSQVISHYHDMGAWKPDLHQVVEGHDLYRWIIPANVSGTWEWTMAWPGTAAMPFRMTLDQTLGTVTGQVARNGEPLVLRQVHVTGSQLVAVIEEPVAAGSLTLTARVGQDVLAGIAAPAGPAEAFPWQAKRVPGTWKPLD